MKTVRPIAGVILCAAGSVFGAEPAEASCNPLSVCSCTASASGINFGGYDPLSASPTDSTGTVTVTCTFTAALGSTYTINLSTGGSGSYTARRMSQGASTLTYNLYTNVARSTVWGDGTGAQAVTGALSGLLTDTQIFTVYGRIPGNQNVPSGNYSDAITVTVIY